MLHICAVPTPFIGLVPAELAVVAAVEAPFDAIALLPAAVAMPETSDLPVEVAIPAPFELPAAATIAAPAPKTVDVPAEFRTDVLAADALAAPTPALVAMVVAVDLPVPLAAPTPALLAIPANKLLATPLTALLPVLAATD